MYYAFFYLMPSIRFKVAVLFIAMKFHNVPFWSWFTILYRSPWINIKFDAAVIKIVAVGTDTATSYRRGGNISR